MAGIALILVIVLIIVIFNKQNQDIGKPDIPPPENRIEEPEEDIKQEEEEKTIILDIPSLSNKDAFEILDILTSEYGEPNPVGLIDVLKEIRGLEEPTFETVTWVDIKYGYNFTFNFWTDGSLAREDSYYIIGYKSKNHTIDEILQLTKLDKDDTNFIFNITDLGGAVFNIGITPIEAAQKEPPGEEKPEELSRNEILEILEENARKKWEEDPARFKLEYESQVKAYDWVISQKDFLDIMEKAMEEWEHDYVMVKWEYEKRVKEYQETL